MSKVVREICLFLMAGIGNDWELEHSIDGRS